MYQMWGMHVPGASAIGHLEVCRESCGQPESLPCGIILPSKASQHSQCHLHICIPSLLREHRGVSDGKPGHILDAIPQCSVSCYTCHEAHWKQPSFWQPGNPQSVGLDVGTCAAARSKVLSAWDKR